MASSLLSDIDPDYAKIILWNELDMEPQPGPQASFLNSEADITIYGGAAGGGKTFGELLDPLQWVHVPDFGAVIFRRTTTMIRAEGGLWDESENIYPKLGAVRREQRLDWKFPSGAKISFAHMEYEKNRLDWQGSQICLISFDELTHFTKRQFFYMLSRNRSTCGVKPRIRATCNPDAESWVAEFIGWWIDQDTGFAIPERAGKKRYFVQQGDDLIWGASAEELNDLYPELMPKSVTFIPAYLEDNPALVTKDPGYRGRLMALDRVERERLLKGNWKIRPEPGNYFRREWFNIIDVAPECELIVRYWDFAGSKKRPGKDPDWTVGFLLGFAQNRFIILDIVRMQESPGTIKAAVKATAGLDGRYVPIFIEQEPGSASLHMIEDYRDELPGYILEGVPSTGSKIVRAGPVSSAVEHGRVDMVRAAWNKAFVTEAELFPDGAHDDQVDGFSGAHTAIVDLLKQLSESEDEYYDPDIERVNISPI